MKKTKAVGRPRFCPIGVNMGTRTTEATFARTCIAFQKQQRTSSESQYSLVNLGCKDCEVGPRISQGEAPGKLVSDISWITQAEVESISRGTALPPPPAEGKKKRAVYNPMSYKLRVREERHADNHSARQAATQTKQEVDMQATYEDIMKAIGEVRSTLSKEQKAQLIMNLFLVQDQDAVKGDLVQKPKAVKKGVVAAEVVVEKRPVGKESLNLEQVKSIKRLLHNGEERGKIAEQFHVSKTTVGRIARGERYSEVPI